MRIDVVTIFPEYLAPLELSLLGKAQRDGILQIRVHDLREVTTDRHRTVDDTPYGGGAGMVMKPEPWAAALARVCADGPTGQRPVLIIPGPGGERFTQQLARELAQEPWLAFACGRYEGIDERVYAHAADHLRVRTISLGDYVLNGGEVAVLAMVEAMGRLLPGVVGNAESLVEESHEDGLLEYPVYTKPASWTRDGVTREVPPVLLSGDHGAIARWRHAQRLERTAARRPDLLAPAAAVGALADLDAALATPADLPELVVLTRACWVPEAAASGTFDFPPFTDGVPELTASLSEWTTYVWRAAGRLVASIRVRRDPEDDRVWQLGRFMVAPDLQGRGIGQEILTFAESLAPRDVSTIWINTGRVSERNIRIYRKAGFRLAPWDSQVHPATVDLIKSPRSRADKG
ncbi:MAG: tRNA (guanosine(37)-N1)-methyltransferase TrmD [Tetrasphaera sp.]|nr:tRNA (guanosine(37)-N1)-methyltransferase TrmD [Tetrasphaera sp.]